MCGAIGSLVKARLAAAGLGAHVEEPAVVGLPHVAQAPGHGQHGPRLAGHVVQDHHAVGQHGRQARAAVLRIGQVAGPPALRDPAAEVGRRPQALGVLGPVVIRRAGARSRPGLPARVAVPGEPVGGEDRPVAVRAEDHLYRGVRGQDARHGHVGRQAGDGGEALPTARVLAAGAGAVGAQPHRRQPSQRGMARAVRFPRPVRPGCPRRLGPHRAAGQACHTGLRRFMARATQRAAPGVRLAGQAVPSRPSYGLLPALMPQGAECQLRWWSLPDSATQLPIAVHPHDRSTTAPARPPAEGDGTRQPRAKPGSMPGHPQGIATRAPRCFGAR